MLVIARILGEIIEEYISAALAGGVGLAKSTGGTVLLSGTNLYTGTTTITGGTLDLQGNDAILDANTVDVQVGTLDVTDAETINILNTTAGTGLVNLDDTLTVAAGGTAAGNISGTSGLTLTGGTGT